MLDRVAHQLPLLDAKRAGTELFGAPRLNAFRVFNPNENTLSRIIGDLLDPEGSHGQGAVFLNALLDRVGLPRSGANDPVRVRREALTAAGRRIDLVIETPRSLLGIENKPWAGQQHRQLSDYMDALKSWARGRQMALVFLSDQEPRTAKNQVFALPFISDEGKVALDEMLEAVLDRVKAPRAREHVQELLTYLNWQFGDGTMIDDGEEAYVEAVETEFAALEHRRSVAAVLLARDRIHKRVLDEIGAYFHATLAGPAGLFEVSEGALLSEALAEKWSSWLLRKTTWPSNLAIAIEANNTCFGGVCYGVHAPDPNDPEVREWKSGCAARPVIERALRNFGDGRTTKWWPWWKWANTRVWGPEYAAKLVLHSPTGRVENHSDISELAKTMPDLAEVIDRVLAAK